MKGILRLAVILGVTAGVVWTGSVANAYSGTSAATYANKYATSPNGAYYHYTDDCTNFVSQSMRAGGHKFHGTPSGLILNDNSQWWELSGGAGRTLSWSVADDLDAFINLHDGTTAEYSYWDGGQPKTLPSAIKAGDPVFYQWDDTSGNAFNHSSIVVGSGTDPNSGWVGTLIDQHTTNRSHAIWNLRPYNAKWMTTSTEVFHLSTTD